MARLPATLQGFTCFIDGEGYAGIVSRGTPPKLRKRIRRHGAGMPGEIGLFVKYEMMECTFTLREFNPDAVRQMLITDMSGEGSLLVRMVAAQQYEGRPGDGPVDQLGNLSARVSPILPPAIAQPLSRARLVARSLGLLGDAGPVAVQWTCGGQLTEMDPGDIDAQSPDAELTFRMICSRVKLSVGGAVVWDLDIPAGQAIVNGVDQWQGVKAILEG